MKCTKRRTDGEPCQGNAISGLDACPAHTGTTLAKAKAKGDLVVEVRRWKVGDEPEEPGPLLMKLMTVAEWKRQAYEAEIDRILASTGLPLSEALVGDSIVVDKDGSPHVVGEYIRGIVQLEQQALETAAGLAIKGIAAGLDERRVRLAESQGARLAESGRAYIAGVIDALGLDATAAAPIMQRLFADMLRSLAGGAPLAVGA